MDLVFLRRVALGESNNKSRGFLTSHTKPVTSDVHLVFECFERDTWIGAFETAQALNFVRFQLFICGVEVPHIRGIAVKASRPTNDFDFL